MSLFSELKRRNVFKVAAAYAIVGWLLVQVADVFFPALQLPAWTVSFVAALLILGFPVALLLSWAYELTPDGVKRTKSLLSPQSMTRVSSRKLDFLVIGLLAVAVVFMVVDNYLPARGPFAGAEIDPGSLEPVQDEVESPAAEQLNDTDATDRPSIAALPFANESAEEENAEFFANGIHDELLTQLAKIGSLKVISRTSVEEYRNSPKNLRQIGQELDVSTVLEGRVQRAGDRVRINVQLIDAQTDAHLWADVYDRELNAQNIFDIQREMATSIADALQATLQPSEVARLSEIPTENTLAYDFYRRGNDYYSRPNDRTFVPLAVQQYERAVDEDPAFAEAWAGLSRAHSKMYLYSELDRSEARLQMALDAVERAFSLKPELPEAHLALAQYYYQGRGDYDRALEQLRIAEEALPGDASILEMRAYMLRRTGEFAQSLADFDRALELDPRNVDTLLAQARTYAAVRDYVRAEATIRHTLTISPNEPVARMFSIWVSLLSRGEMVPPLSGGDNLPLPSEWMIWLGSLYQRDYDSALEFLAEIESDEVGTGRPLILPKALAYAQTYQLAGDSDRASESFRAARTQIEARINENPEDARLHAALGQILAPLGERAEAIRAGRRAIELLPTTADSIVGPYNREAMFRTLIATGDYDEAIDELDSYLAAPADWSIEGFLPDPRLDPIRELPSFRALVAKYRRSE